MSMLSSYFARTDDLYAGGDVENAQRMGTVLWGLLVLLAVVLVPLNPPTEAVGSIGWVPGALLLVAGIAVTYAMRRGELGSWSSLLAVSYGTVVAIGLLQWLSGGQNAPFRGLLLLPVLFAAATQPPRKIAPFMGMVFLVLAAPFAYDAWDTMRAEAVAATFVIWCALAAGASLLMGGVRLQRLTLQQEGQQARVEARLDSLTGLRNRRSFDEVLAGEVARAKRHDLPLSIGMVDIEAFKEINDRWSYAEGDRCLREVAIAIQDGLRQPDFCFRWGGDEFALILSGTPERETGSVEKRLRARVSETCIRPDGSPIRIRFASAELREGMAPRDLTEIAGIYLTAARGGGDQATSATSSR